MHDIQDRLTSIRRGIRFSHISLRQGILAGCGDLQRRYGNEAMELILFNMKGRRAYLATHPAHIGVVLNDTESFRRAEMFLGNLEEALGFNAVTVRANEWNTVRRRTLAFLSGHTLASYHELMTRVLELSTIPHWECESAAGRPIDVFDSMLEYSSRVVFSAFLGVPDHEIPRHLHGTLNDMFDAVRERVLLLIKWPLWIPMRSHRRFRRLRGEVFAYLEQVLERRAEGPGSMFEHLVQAHSTHGTLDKRRFLEEMLGNLIGGSETTIVLLVWTLHYLAHNPEVQQRLHRELAEQPQGASRAPRSSLLHRCLTETLRIRSPAYLSARETTRPVELGGVELPVGSNVVVSQYLTHNDPRVWPDPHRYDPDRFDRVPTKTTRDYTNFFPFGGGRNICTGQSYAYQEAAITVSGLVRRFEILPSTPREVGISAELTLRPGIPVQVLARPRKEPPA